MNETTENFWQAWQAWNPEPPKPVFFRLYYDDQGYPLFYSMEDLPGQYIEIDAECYRMSSHRVRVVNGQLVKLSNNSVKKLVPSETGTPCDPRDVCVVVDQDRPHIKWSLRTNDIN
jgi:hypothetical protein